MEFELTTQSLKYKYAIFTCSTHWATQATDSQLSVIAVYVKKYHVHFCIIYTMNAEDIFRSLIGCEIMLMIKARIRLIFSRYNVSYLSNLCPMTARLNKAKV